jgi:hypothetical protein
MTALFNGFPQFLCANAAILPSNKPRLDPSTLFQIGIVLYIICAGDIAAFNKHTAVKHPKPINPVFP